MLVSNNHYFVKDYGIIFIRPVNNLLGNAVSFVTYNIDYFSIESLIKYT